MKVQIDELLHPRLDKKNEKDAMLLAKGLPAGPGGASGRVVFTADDAESWHKNGEKVILIREETSPEDVHGMHASEAILTAKGGMTSHAALVARGWGKCCIVGCSSPCLRLVLILAAVLAVFNFAPLGCDLCIACSSTCFSGCFKGGHRPATPRRKYQIELAARLGTPFF